MIAFINCIYYYTAELFCQMNSTTTYFKDVKVQRCDGKLTLRIVSAMFIQSFVAINGNEETPFQDIFVIQVPEAKSS